MRYFILIICILWASQAFAEPFLICDPPEEGVTIASYKVKGYTTIPDEVITVPAIADGSINMDLVDAKIGTSNLLVSACPPEDSGVECSDDAPFTMTRHSAPNTPPNVRMIK